MRTLYARGVGIELPHAEGSLANRTPWKGILCTIDTPSQRPPGGSSGRRVIVTRHAALRALPSLIGAPVNVESRTFADHDRTQPIGLVTRAYLEGQNLVVEGVLFAKNFPDVVATIQRHRSELGLSYEIADCEIASTQDPIWRLTSFTFTGCSILKQAAAAYGDSTSIAAKAAPLCDYAGILAQLRYRARAL